MKLYAEKPGADISIADKDALDQSLRGLFAKFPVGAVIETGTFLGLGSTVAIARALAAVHRAADIYTIEASFEHWQQACKNLAPFENVHCLWGLSVPHEVARDFIHADPALRHHESEPSIYIDCIDDPVAFYLREIDGELSPSARGPNRATRRHYYREGLLAELLAAHKDFRPLVVLDSAGGIGWLEYQVLLKTMSNVPFALLLDDVDHVKHFRSLRALERDVRFTVEGRRDEAGWLLATFRPDSA